MLTATFELIIRPRDGSEWLNMKAVVKSDYAVAYLALGEKTSIIAGDNVMSIAQIFCDPINETIRVRLKGVYAVDAETAAALVQEFVKLGWEMDSDRKGL